MNRPYTAHSPYSLTPTERIRSPRDDATETVNLDYGDYGGYEEYVGLEEYDDSDVYEDYDDYEPIDRRWVWIAGVAGAILLVAVICTFVILGGGDSGSVSTTVAAPTTTQPAATTSAPPAASTPPSLPPAAPLPPETVTTLTPSASAAPSTSTAPTEAAPVPRTVTYTVTGNRQLIDLVTVIYTDQQGALQTDVNVALPWSKTVALDPGVELSSVTATSVGGQLNCSITDGAGALIAQQNANSMIATCTK
jgi:Mycobacterium membrane protein